MATAETKKVKFKKPGMTQRAWRLSSPDLEVGKHSVMVTQETVDAFKLGYEVGFLEGYKTKLPNEEGVLLYIAMMRNDWLTAKGVDKTKRSDW
jgi:hypothetical protein